MPYQWYCVVACTPSETIAQWSQSIPIIAEFLNEDGSDSLSETIEANYKCVKQEILSLVESEIERIKNDAKLKHLIKE